MGSGVPVKPVRVTPSFASHRIHATRLLLLWTRSLCVRDPLETLQLALEGGVDIVQLREKNATARELYELGTRIAPTVARHGALFVVNDRIDVALALNADGVHLGQGDLPLADARRIARPPFLIGVSTHTAAQARAAAQEGADFVGFGPIFGTPTKPAEPPVGPAGLAEAERSVPIPVFAIGGLTAARIEQLGIRRAAVSSAILAVEDPLVATQQIRNALTRI